MRITHRPAKMLYRWAQYLSEIKKYIIFLILPLLMCGALFVGVRGVTINQMRERGQLSVSRFQSRVDTVLREAQMVSGAILRDKTILTMLNTKSGEGLPKPDEVLSICAALSEHAAESAYISDVYVISSNLGRIFSRGGYYTDQSLSAILSQYGVARADYDLSLKRDTDAEWYIKNQNGFSTYSVTAIRSDDGKTIGALLLTINMPRFLRIFYNDGAAMSAVYNDSCVISTLLSPLNPRDVDWHSDKEVSRLLGYAVNCSFIEGGDFTYLVAVSSENYNTPLRMIAYIFVVYFVLMLIGGLLYINMAAKRRHAEITSLIETFPQRLTENSSYNEIISEVRSVLLELKNKRDVDTFYTESENLLNVLYAHYVSITPDILLSAGIHESASVFYVVSFFIETSPVVMPVRQESPEMHNVAQVIFRTVIGNLSQGKSSVAICNNVESLVAVFYNEWYNGYREAILDICKSAVELLAQSYGIGVRAIVSSIVRDPSLLPAAFGETKSLHSFARSVDSEAAIISGEDFLSSGYTVMDGSFLKQLQILTNMLLTGKFDHIAEAVEAILTGHVSPLRENYTLVRSRLHSVGDILAENIISLTIPGVDKKAAERIRGADSVSKLLSMTREAYSDITKLASNAGTNDPVARALAYIHANISDVNLNVPAICETVELSAQHLTRLFKHKLDMTIAEYFNAYRIRLSKELLSDRRVTLSQIAERVGYNSLDTYTRNFRKLEGINPNEYRNLRL